MPTKNTTIRLDKEMIKEVDERCKEQTCTRNDYIKKAIDNQLELDVSIENEENTPGPDRNPTPKETKPEPKPTLEKIPEPKVEDVSEIENPKIVETDFNPNNYEIKSEPKIIIKEVLQNNSNKPEVKFTQFNGKLLPFAKRYNL